MGISALTKHLMERGVAQQGSSSSIIGSHGHTVGEPSSETFAQFAERTIICSQGSSTAITTLTRFWTRGSRTSVDGLPFHRRRVRMTSACIGICLSDWARWFASQRFCRAGVSSVERDSRCSSYQQKGRRGGPLLLITAARLLIRNFCSIVLFGCLLKTLPGYVLPRQLCFDLIQSVGEVSEL